MRLIDADALREEHCEGCPNAIIEGCKTDPLCASLLWVNDAPTVDAVEVVRCGECRHYGGVVFGRTCRMFSGSHTRIDMPEDGYCSYGERRENEQA